MHLCMYVHISIYMHVCPHGYMHMLVCAIPCVFVYVHVHAHTCMYMHMCMSDLVYVSVQNKALKGQCREDGVALGQGWLVCGSS